jgi:hypothetical protein
MMRVFTLILAVVLSTGTMRAQTPAQLPPLTILPIDNNALATLAVQDHGRKKPFTTFAHEMLLSICRRNK